MLGHKRNRLRDELGIWALTGGQNLSMKLCENMEIFVLRINLAFATNLSFIKNMTNLITLNLSNNLRLGFKNIFFKHLNYGWDGPLMRICDFGKLENLYLENVQYSAAQGYMTLFDFSLMKCTHDGGQIVPLPLKRLSLHGNSLGRIDMGFSVIMLNLEYFSISDNAL